MSWLHALVLIALCPLWGRVALASADTSHAGDQKLQRVLKALAVAAGWTAVALAIVGLGSLFAALDIGSGQDAGLGLI